MSAPTLDPAIQEYITKRHAVILDAYNSHSAEKILAYFSEDVDFSDFSAGVVNLNKAALVEYIRNMIKACTDLMITTRSITGTKEFTAWEWGLSFKFDAIVAEAAADPEFSADKADGRLINMLGVSLSWWNEKDQIVKNHDYAKVVPSGDDKK